MSSTYADSDGTSLPSALFVQNIGHDDSHRDTSHLAVGRIGLTHQIPEGCTLPVICLHQELSDLSVELGYPSETTPLLSNPPVPHSEEPRDNVNKAENNLAAPWIFWDESKILCKYSLPIFGTGILEYSIVIVSVGSIGHISTTALAAVALGSMTANVTGFTVIQGMASALDTLLPSAWTSQPQLVGLWCQRMSIVMLACLIPTLLIWLNAESIFLFLRQDPEVARLAATYLRWVSLGLPADTFNCISRRYFQSQGLFTVPTRIFLVVAPTNVLINYLLVWGPKPIRLGFIGAPIATVISFNLISLLSIIYGVFFVPRTAWCPISRRSFTGFGLLLQLGLSGVGQTASEWWAWELISLAASFFGPVALAAQSVLFVSGSTASQIHFALGVATAVRIGNLLGEGNDHRARVSAHTSLMLALILAFITSAIFLLFRSSWGYLFNNDPKVVALVASTMPLISLLQAADATAAVAGGILRARGEQFLGAILSLSAYYVFGLPLGVLFAFKLQYGLRGMWVSLILALTYCAVLGTWLSLRTDWNLEVQKVQDRLKEEDERRRTLGIPEA